MNNFKPELIPNSKTGNEFELVKNVLVPSDYFVSLKHDGARVEIMGAGPGLSRALKVLNSGHVQAMIEDIKDCTGLMTDEILECEFYSPEMTFSEIMHFFKSSDVTAEKNVKRWNNEWAKTSQGTATYTKTKNGEAYEQGWEFPGRTPEWLCSWHDSLKLYAFNLVDTLSPNQTKAERDADLAILSQVYDKTGEKSNFKYVWQHTFDTHEQIQEFYDEAIENDEEGAVLVRKDAIYKNGRHTMNSGNIFKMKENTLEFDGEILSVEEATEARVGSVKTVNELGRSKTSQLKADRVPSGIAKGFLVRMEDGRELTVGLNGFDNQDKRRLLIDNEAWVGVWIRFTGMNPAKHGGVPRHARYSAGNRRESK